MAKALAVTRASLQTVPSTSPIPPESPSWSPHPNEAARSDHAHAATGADHRHRPEGRGGRQRDEAKAALRVAGEAHEWNRGLAPGTGTGRIVARCHDGPRRVQTLLW